MGLKAMSHKQRKLAATVHPNNSSQAFEAKALGQREQPKNTNVQDYARKRAERIKIKTVGLC
jgi:hypothetical protein